MPFFIRYFDDARSKHQLIKIKAWNMEPNKWPIYLPNSCMITVIKKIYPKQFLGLGESAKPRVQPFFCCGESFAHKKRPPAIQIPLKKEWPCLALSLTGLVSRIDLFIGNESRHLMTGFPHGHKKCPRPWKPQSFFGHGGKVNIKKPLAHSATPNGLMWWLRFP